MRYPAISVIVPCYREAEVIEKNILLINEYLKEHFERFEIIAVTDGSPDQTRQNIERLQKAQPTIPLLLLPFVKNHGKGAAVRAGVLASQYDPILFIDADLTIPITELEKFMPALASADMAIASRLSPGAQFEEQTPWYRTILARGFYILQMILLGNFDFSDTQCGFKLFRRNVALEIFKKITVKRFAFDAEVLFLAKKSKLKVTVLPVTILKDPRNTSVNALYDPFNMLCALIKIRWNDWNGKYN